MLLHKDEQLLQLPTSERTILSQSIQKHRPFALPLPCLCQALALALVLAHANTHDLSRSVVTAMAKYCTTICPA